MQVFTKQYPAEVFPQYLAVLSDLGVDAFSRHSNAEVVAEGYGSPYVFGRKMRCAVGDETAPIYSCAGVYWCVSKDGLVSFCRSSELRAALIPTDAIAV